MGKGQKEVQQRVTGKQEVLLRIDQLQPITHGLSRQLCTTAPLHHGDLGCGIRGVDGENGESRHGRQGWVVGAHFERGERNTQVTTFLEVGSGTSQGWGYRMGYEVVYLLYLLGSL